MNITRGKDKRLKVATNRHEANIVLSIQIQFFNNILKHIIHIILYRISKCMVLNGKKNTVVIKNVNMLFTCTI